MNTLVKIKSTDDGEIINNPKWCLSTDRGGRVSFCTQDYYGSGESDCDYELKEVVRGGITCLSCLEKIKEIKAVKL